MLTALGSAAEVLVATGHDPFARGSLRRPLVRGWVASGATAWLGVDEQAGRPCLSALGQPMAVARLVAELLPELPPRQRVTLPRGTGALLPAWVGLGAESTEWDFRWLAAPPPVQAAEERVVAGVDGAAVDRLLSAAGASVPVRPGDGTALRWWGVPDGTGDLLACAADTSAATGVGHLSSIAVRPDARGRGLGRAVTAAAVRALLGDGCDLVALGLSSDDAPGHAVLDALGFRDEHRLTSGPLVQRGRW